MYLREKEKYPKITFSASDISGNKTHDIPVGYKHCFYLFNFHGTMHEERWKAYLAIKNDKYSNWFNILSACLSEFISVVWVSTKNSVPLFLHLSYYEKGKHTISYNSLKDKLSTC